MSSREPPTETARLLRRLRETAGLTQAQAVQNASPVAGPDGQPRKLTQSLLSKFESGFIVPSREQADALADVYAAGADERAALHAGDREADREHRRVATYRPRAARVQREYAELERDSIRVTTFTPTVVPGLLQTDEYATALAAGELTGEHLEQWLTARRARRAILSEPGREFTQIVTAGALLWGLGDREVMRRQLEHLAAWTQTTRNLALGVVPPATIAAFTVANGFDLYERPEHPPRVIVGTQATVSILDDPGDVALYTDLVTRLRRLAWWGDDARVVLSQLHGWFR